MAAFHSNHYPLSVLTVSLNHLTVLPCAYKPLQLKYFQFFIIDYYDAILFFLPFDFASKTNIIKNGGSLRPEPTTTGQFRREVGPFFLKMISLQNRFFESFLTARLKKF